MSLLLIESGSTKSDCVIIKEKEIQLKFTSVGMNFSTMDEKLLTQSLEVIKNKFDCSIDRLIIYGAGVKTEMKEKWTKIIEKIFEAQIVSVESDLTGAVRAVSQGNDSIVCILGTGSNSCLSDGHQITHNKIALGYLLGDEGGATDIGKKLLTQYFYGHLEESITLKLIAEYPQLQENFLTNLYSAVNKSEILGSIARFAIENKSHHQMSDIINFCIASFFNKRLSYYSPYKERPLHIIGSVGFLLQEEIKTMLNKYDFHNIHFSKKPIEDLVRYHMTYERY